MNDEKPEKQKADVKEFLNRMAYVQDSPIEDDDGKIYLTRYDDSYLGRVGMEEGMQFLADLNIVQQLGRRPGNDEGVEYRTASIGFDPVEQKWYGWSHRAICGFTIGSEVKFGDCAYSPLDEDDFLRYMINFWYDRDAHTECYGVHYKTEDGRQGVEVTWTYNDSVPNKQLHGTSSSSFQEYPKEWGRGEWVAKTLDDARQMAIDFAEGVD
jgi:hypothetical protein